jgi:large subunit ribosomal protein L21
MLHRESIWLHWLARKLFLPGLQAMRGQIDEALAVLAKFEAEPAPAPPPSPARQAVGPAFQPAFMDDLTAIRGIGPAIQARLRLAGITSYADLANRSPEELARIARRSADRVVAEQWIEQAREKSTFPEAPSFREGDVV